jgi:hypothetical protein
VLLESKVQELGIGKWKQVYSRPTLRKIEENFLLKILLWRGGQGVSRDFMVQIGYNEMMSGKS